MERYNCLTRQVNNQIPECKTRTPALPGGITTSWQSMSIYKTLAARDAMNPRRFFSPGESLLTHTSICTTLVPTLLENHLLNSRMNIEAAP